eukprot:g10452.t1
MKMPEEEDEQQRLSSSRARLGGRQDLAAKPKPRANKLRTAEDSTYHDRGHLYFQMWKGLLDALRSTEQNCQTKAQSVIRTLANLSNPQQQWHQQRLNHQQRNCSFGGGLMVRSNYSEDRVDPELLDPATLPDRTPDSVMMFLIRFLTFPEHSAFDHEDITLHLDTCSASEEDEDLGFLLTAGDHTHTSFVDENLSHNSNDVIARLEKKSSGGFGGDLDRQSVITRSQLAAQELMNNLYDRTSCWSHHNLPQCKREYLLQQLMYAFYTGRHASAAHITGVVSHCLTNSLQMCRGLFVDRGGQFLQWLGMLIPERGVVDLLLMLFLGPNSNFQPGPVKAVAIDLDLTWTQKACHFWLKHYLSDFLKTPEERRAERLERMRAAAAAAAGGKMKNGSRGKGSGKGTRTGTGRDDGEQEQSGAFGVGTVLGSSFGTLSGTSVASSTSTLVKTISGTTAADEDGAEGPRGEMMQEESTSDGDIIVVPPPAPEVDEEDGFIFRDYPPGFEQYNAGRSEPGDDLQDDTDHNEGGTNSKNESRSPLEDEEGGVASKSGADVDKGAEDDLDPLTRSSLLSEAGVSDHLQSGDEDEDPEDNSILIPHFVQFLLRLLEHLEKAPKMKELQVQNFLATLVQQTPLLKFLGEMVSRDNDECVWDALRCLELILSLDGQHAVLLQESLLEKWIWKEPARADYGNFNLNYPASPVECGMMAAHASLGLGLRFSSSSSSSSHSLGVPGDFEMTLVPVTGEGLAEGSGRSALYDQDGAPSSTSSSSGSSTISSVGAEPPTSTGVEMALMGLDEEGRHKQEQPSTSSNTASNSIATTIPAARAPASESESTKSTVRLGSYVTGLLRLISVVLKGIIKEEEQLRKERLDVANRLGRLDEDCSSDEDVELDDHDAPPPRPRSCGLPHSVSEPGNLSAKALVFVDDSCKVEDIGGGGSLHGGAGEDMFGEQDEHSSPSEILRSASGPAIAKTAKKSRKTTAKDHDEQDGDCDGSNIELADLWSRHKSTSRRRRDVLDLIPVVVWQRWRQWYQQTTKRNQTAHLYLTQLFKLLTSHGSADLQRKILPDVLEKAILEYVTFNENIYTAQSFEQAIKGGINLFSWPLAKSELNSLFKRHDIAPLPGSVPSTPDKTSSCSGGLQEGQGDRDRLEKMLVLQQGLRAAGEREQNIMDIMDDISEHCAGLVSGTRSRGKDDEVACSGDEGNAEDFYRGAMEEDVDSDEELDKLQQDVEAGLAEDAELYSEKNDDDPWGLARGRGPRGEMNHEEGGGLGMRKIPPLRPPPPPGLAELAEELQGRPPSRVPPPREPQLNVRESSSRPDAELLSAVIDDEIDNALDGALREHFEHKVIDAPCDDDDDVSPPARPQLWGRGLIDAILRKNYPNVGGVTSPPTAEDGGDECWERENSAKNYTETPPSNSNSNLRRSPEELQEADADLLRRVAEGKELVKSTMRNLKKVVAEGGEEGFFYGDTTEEDNSGSTNSSGKSSPGEDLLAFMNKEHPNYDPGFLFESGGVGGGVGEDEEKHGEAGDESGSAGGEIDEDIDPIFNDSFANTSLGRKFFNARSAAEASASNLFQSETGDFNSTRNFGATTMDFNSTAAFGHASLTGRDMRCALNNIHFYGEEDEDLGEDGAPDSDAGDELEDGDDRDEDVTTDPGDFFADQAEQEADDEVVDGPASSGESPAHEPALNDEDLFLKPVEAAVPPAGDGSREDDEERAEAEGAERSNQHEKLVGVGLEYEALLDDEEDEMGDGIPDELQEGESIDHVPVDKVNGSKIPTQKWLKQEGTAGYVDLLNHLAFATDTSSQDAMNHKYIDEHFLLMSNPGCSSSPTPAAGPGGMFSGSEESDHGTSNTNSSKDHQRAKKRFEKNMANLKTMIKPQLFDRLQKLVERRCAIQEVWGWEARFKKLQQTVGSERATVSELFSTKVIKKCQKGGQEVEKVQNIRGGLTYFGSAGAGNAVIRAV